MSTVIHYWSPGWMPRDHYDRCTVCSGSADFLYLEGEVMIPACRECACGIVHPGEPPAPLDSGLMPCPACQIRWAELA